MKFFVNVWQKTELIDEVPNMASDGKGSEKSNLAEKNADVTLMVRMQSSVYKGAASKIKEKEIYKNKRQQSCCRWYIDKHKIYR